MKGFAVITAWVSVCTFVMLIMAPQTTNGLPAGRKTNGLLVNLTILESGVSKGAVCLDGSPPAYNFAPGFGKGVNNWLVHFEGGGWCHNVTNCLYRSRRGRLGTSKAMKTTSFNGILNDRMELNPDFYNWNKIKIRYCDGSSYTGDVESVDPRTNLHYRGARIFVAMMEELLAKGMKNAENALLSGCSAGGLASLLHCDRFRALLPASARVKCLSDAGFFVNAKDITGVEYMRGFFKDIATTHNSAKNLPPACTSRLRPDMCFFPQYMVKHIETPFFLLNSAYDSWQIRNVLVPPGADPEGAWDACRSDISLCNTEQIQAMQVFREEFLKAVGRFGHRPSAGMFINSCFAHCQTELTRMWHAPNSPVLGNLTVADAVGKWFFDRGEFKKVDCPYPCDTSCQTMKYPNPKGHVDPDSPQEPAAAAAAAPAAENPGLQPQDPKPAAGAPEQNPAGQPQDHDKPVRRDPDQAPAAGAPAQNPAGQPKDHDKPVRRDPDQAPAAGAPEQTPAGQPQDHDKPVRRDPEAPAAGAPDEKINPAGASPDQAVPAGAPEEINPGRSQLAPAGAPDQEEGADPPVEGPADHQARYRNLDHPPEKADLSEGNPAKSSAPEWQLTLKRHLFLLPAASLFLFYLM